MFCHLFSLLSEKLLDYINLNVPCYLPCILRCCLMAIYKHNMTDSKFQTVRGGRARTYARTLHVIHDVCLIRTNQRQRQVDSGYASDWANGRSCYKRCMAYVATIHIRRDNEVMICPYCYRCQRGIALMCPQIQPYITGRHSRIPNINVFIRIYVCTSNLPPSLHHTRSRLISQKKAQLVSVWQCEENTIYHVVVLVQGLLEAEGTKLITLSKPSSLTEMTTSEHR